MITTLPVDQINWKNLHACMIISQFVPLFQTTSYSPP
jgi:hypothetical protein